MRIKNRRDMVEVISVERTLKNIEVLQIMQSIGDEGGPSPECAHALCKPLYKFLTTDLRNNYRHCFGDLNKKSSFGKTGVDYVDYEAKILDRQERFLDV